MSSKDSNSEEEKECVGMENGHENMINSGKPVTEDIPRNETWPLRGGAAERKIYFSVGYDAIIHAVTS